MPSYKLDIIVGAKDNASKVLGGLGKTLGKVGKIAAVLGVTSAITGIGIAAVKTAKDAIKLATDFETQMAILSIAAQGSGESFAGLHDAAIAVGGDISLLGVSASGAADSMTGLYKAGLTTTEIFGDLQGYMAGTAELGGALRASIDLAAATELDMVQASDLAAIALATFGGEMKTEAERAEFVNFAMNNMVKAANASVAEVSDLSAALSTIGPTAAAFGWGIDELNNALALLSTRGISGAEAGTSLKSMLTNMMRPTTKTVDAMNALGISLYDSEGNMRSLKNIVGQFSTSLAGMTEEQRNAYIQQIAGTYGMKALQTLMAEGVEGWDAMAAATANAAGIQEQAANRANTLAGAQEALSGIMETLKITAGEALLPALTGLTRWASEMADMYGPMVVGIVQAIIDIFGRLASGDFDWMSLIPPAAIGLFWSFQGLLDRLAEWWEVNGPGIAATGQALGETLITAFQDLATNVLPWLAEKLDEFGIWFTDNGPLIQQFVAVVAEAFGILVEQTVLAWEWIEPILDLLISGFFNVGTLIMQMVTGDWAGAWLTAETILWDTIEGFQLAFTELADWVTGWFGSDWASVMAQWSTNWELFSVIATTAWDNITTAIENAISKIKGWIDAFVAKLQSVTLPSWLQGHSPPPLANWLDDISTSIQGVAKADLSGALSVAPGGAGSSSSQVTNNYRFDQTVNTRASTHSIMNDWALAQALAP